MTTGEKKPLPPHCAQVGLVLQGGGALGAYQAGVYAALAEAGYEPDWIAGVSIGAINGAIIAGNPPRAAGRAAAGVLGADHGRPAEPSRCSRATSCAVSSTNGARLPASPPGVPGFFRPRMPPAWLQPWGTRGRAQLLRHGAAARDARTADRFRPAQLRATRALQRRRRQHSQGQLGLLRHRGAPHRARAHHGERRPAAGLPADRDRRRALLGRRRPLQHAARVPARRPRATRACWCSRSTCSAPAG